MNMRVNDIPTGAEIIASHQEATSDFVYKRERECVCVICPFIHHPTTDDLLLAARAIPSLWLQS